MKRFWFNLALLLVLLSGQIALAQEAPYLNPDLPIEERVEDLLARMSLEEKIGQMTLVEKNSITPADAQRYFIGGILSGGGGYPTPNTPEAWLEMVTAYQDAALETPLGIPVIYGVDAVHGHNNVYGAVIFPHNIGLGATRNPDLAREIGRITAAEMIATGIYWDYAPMVGVPQDIRWGRTYEGYGENTELVTEIGLAYLQGLQGENLSDPGSVLATPKHYVGDGGTAFGTSEMDGGFLDRGVTDVDEETLRAVHFPPYPVVVDAGAMSIMASFSSWGGLKMHAQDYLLTEVLKGELDFEGFVVSDWAGIDEISDDYYEAVVTSINAGVDMNMVPTDYLRFIEVMERAVESGDIPMERVDDAVRRILRVKFALGLFERPTGDDEMMALFGSEEHRAVAREAVSQSLVLLKNENEALPIAEDTQTIFIAGTAADDIGIQSGGWTIEWQGQAGNITEGTTIREAIEATAPEATEIHFNRFGQFNNVNDAQGNPLVADVGVVVLGEQPYAEWFGDNETLALTPADLQTVQRMRERSEKLIVILLSGRPLIINEELNLSDAFVAAWLPGSEGQGVADVLFGDKPFTGKLSYTWPRMIDQLPFDFANLPTEGCEAPLFPYGYGLDYTVSDSPYLELAVECAPEVAVSETGTSVAAEILGDNLAPEGVPQEVYYAPFPVQITLDGQFGDWEDVPRVTVPGDATLTTSDPAVTFAAAAGDEYLYMMAEVIDDNIISGQHDTNYWNEDSIEFYINATGDLTLTQYTDGVAQITVPPLNIGQSLEDLVLSGINGTTVDAEAIVVKTATGYAVELAVPLSNDVWAIVPEQGGVLGFQVHVNVAATSNRDSKLIWSAFDPNDQSYNNPSLFGQLIFHEVQQ